MQEVKKNKKKKTLLEKCTDKKKKNEDFAKYIAPLTTMKNAIRIEECGGFIQMLADKDLEKKKLHKGNFCGHRFCPYCAWRQAMKDSAELKVIMEYLKREKNLDFLFLTLTTPNVQGDSLEAEIKHFNESFKRLMKRKEVMEIAKGYVRKLEVTYQKEPFITKELWKSNKRKYYINKGLTVGDPEPNYNTYNPHFHVVIAVDKSYFNNARKHISQEKWLKMWQEATGDNSITQVKASKLRESKDKEKSNVYEVAKYTAKDSEYLVNAEVFEIFYNALKGKQVLVLGGAFKEARKLYKNKELDQYKNIEDTEYKFVITYTWRGILYEQSKPRGLTPEERQEENDKYIEEVEID